jgi:Lrp/AsnC family leucine-responsive transcriptional regulator
MAATAEVRECHNVTGTVEYLLRVEAADLPSYKRFHTDILGAAAGGDDHDLRGDGLAQG